MTATAKELNDLGLWEKLCEQSGMSLWAMAEGQIDPDETFTYNVGE